MNHPPRISGIRKPPAGAWILACVFLLAMAGCRGKSRYLENNLPFPPGVDSGVYDGQFVQTDYGFGFPLPPKWLWLRLSAEQEVDEVARFSDPGRDMIMRLSVQFLGEPQSFSKKFWEERSEQDLKDHLFKIEKKESAKEYKTDGAGDWVCVPFRILDPHGNEWSVQEWALQKDDLLIGAHAMIPARMAATDGAQRFLKSLEGSLTQVRWYMPVGPRGISIQRFELQHFTDDFCRALESRSTAKVGAFFDEMYPDRAKWNTWYQQVLSGDPKSFELKAERSGLVINGDDATACFTLTRKDKADSQVKKFERNFKLSKKEGTWKIEASLDRDESTTLHF